MHTGPRARSNGTISRSSRSRRLRPAREKRPAALLGNQGPYGRDARVGSRGSIPLLPRLELLLDVPVPRRGVILVDDLLVLGVTLVPLALPEEHVASPKAFWASRLCCLRRASKASIAARAPSANSNSSRIGQEAVDPRAVRVRPDLGEELVGPGLGLGVDRGPQAVGSPLLRRRSA